MLKISIQILRWVIFQDVKKNLWGCKHYWKYFVSLKNSPNVTTLISTKKLSKIPGAYIDKILDISL